MQTPRRLIWLPEAVDDLERVLDHLKPHGSKPTQRAARCLREAADLLQQFPEAGRPLPDLAPFRDLAVPFGAGAYVIRYRLRDDVVVIVRIWHSRELRPSGFDGGS